MSRLHMPRLYRSACHSFVAFLLLLFAGMAGAEPVDVNSASAKEIAKALSGIGMTKAQAIVEYREKNGSFREPMDLIKVRGVGQKLVENNLADIKTGQMPAAGQ